jgi:hypothetical protein
VSNHGRASEAPILSLTDILTMILSPHYFKTCKISAVALIKMVHLQLLNVDGQDEC